MHAVPGLACPACRGDLRADGELTLTCDGCGGSYPVMDGIPSFVPGPPAGRPSRYQLTVLIPAANQASNLDLDRLLPALRLELRSLEISHELLVVDQGSTDRFHEIAGRHDARLLRQPTPGYGAALRTGFDQALGEYMLTLDADGSHDPSFLRAIWAARAGVDVVIASRYVQGAAAEMPRTRQALSRTLNLVLRRGLSLPYSDLSSGYRLYRRAALASVALQATGFDILQETLIRMVAAGYTIREVPLRYRALGTSRAWLARFALSHLKTFGAMWKLRNSIASADYDARAYESVVPLQRYWQRRRYQVITTMAAGALRVLDVGCGSSRIIGSARMVGLDIVLAKLRYARRYGNPLVHGSIFELPFKDGAFDCVICSEVIEHVPADERVFSELARVLEPGGRLILGTPDYDRWRWRALEWLYGRLAPGGYADEHITHYSRSNLAAYLVARGFTIDSLKYVGGSEMIFALRKSSGTPAARPLPVAAGLRSR
jgi:dolichol-phosphate mannosyltransferase